MKTSFKILLSFVVITSLFATTGQNTVKASDTDKYTTSQVTYTDVYNYLVERGYNVFGITPMSNGLDWKATTAKFGVRYITIVHTNGTSIVDNEDVPM